MGDHGPERFEAGAFAPLPEVRLNLQHDPETIVSEPNNIQFIDTEYRLEIRTDLKPGSAALELVKRGALRGFSVEFYPRIEHRSNGIRVISKALLDAVGLVDRPAYTGSRVEVRAGKTWFASTIPTGKNLGCECVSVGTVNFAQGAFDETIKLAEAGKHDVLAVSGDFNKAIASTKRGTFGLTVTGAGLVIALSDEARTTTNGKILAEQAAISDIYARPIVDESESTFEDSETERVYTDARVRAVLLKTIAGDSGNWKPVEIAQATPAKRAAIKRPVWV